MYYIGSTVDLDIVCAFDVLSDILESRKSEWPRLGQKQLIII